MVSLNSETDYPQEAQVERVAVAEEVGRVRAPRPKPVLVHPAPPEIPTDAEIYSTHKPTVVERRMLKRHEPILDMFTVFSRILAVRFLLFLSLIGAFVLALQAMDRGTIPSISVLIAYSLLTIAPIVFLEIRGKALRA